MKIYLEIFLFFLLLSSSMESIDVKKYLRENLKHYSKIDYEIISPKNINLSVCKIDNSRDIKVTRNLAYVPVIINKNEDLSHTFITLKLKLYKSVLVSNKFLRKNELLNPAYFTIMEKEVSNLRFEPLDEKDRIEHFRSKFNIPENEILQTSMIEKIPEISIGDRVEALFNIGSVNIRFSVTARSEGLTGSIIRVKRDDNKIFKARVINNTTVKIIE